jgi:hypothetical protein
MAEGEDLVFVLLIQGGFIRLRQQNRGRQEHRENEHLSSHAF